MKLPITGTTHTLPFGELSPRDFERLCLWLVGREGYSHPQHLGAAGSEQGRDVLAWKDDKCWAFQCKRYRTFTATDALKEIDKVAELPDDQRPYGLVFVVTCDVRAAARQQAHNHCQEKGLACEFWAGTELDEKVKQHPDIVAEFFQLPAQHVQNEGRLTALARRVTHKEQLSRTLLFVPPLPNNHVKRRLLGELKRIVLRTKGRYVGVWGLPGTGKTVLVCGLIQTYADELHSAFPGGIYWIYGTGDGAGDPRIHSQSQLNSQLPETKPDDFRVATWEEGLRQLQNASARLLARGRWLVVVDNPPDGVDILPALQLSENELLLVITNSRELLRAKSIPEESLLEVQQMDKGEAQELLIRWTTSGPSNKTSAETVEVAKLLGYHPLALAMAGAAVCRSVSPQDAWQDLLDALKAEEIDEISHPVDDYPIPQLPLVFKAVIDTLPVDLQASFPDLAVFPQDTRLALTDLYRMWAPEEERRIRGRVQNLLDRSLLQRTRQDAFTLNSLVRLYLRHSMDNLAVRSRQVVSRLYPDFPPICIATVWGDPLEVKALIEEGEDVDATTPDGATALHAAAERGFDEIMKILADAGGQVGRTFADGRTALELAAQNGHVETVRVLLDNGADPNVQNEEGFAALHSAAQRGHLDVISLLLSRGARTDLANLGRKSALYVAVAAGNWAIVRELLRHASLASQETDQQERPLRMASHRDAVEIMRLLIDAGADVNWTNPNDGATALHAASIDGEADAAQILIQSGARLDSRTIDGFAPLHCAAQEGHLDTVQILLAAGAPVNAVSASGHTALHSAAQGGHAAAVKALIEAGANVEAQTAALYTPLHLAVQAFDLDTVDTLLRAGADVNQRQSDGWAALHLAIDSRRQKLSDGRQQTTLSMSETDFRMATATMLTATLPPIVERLIEAHADVNLPGRNGMSPLHMAAVRDDEASAAVLMAAGARPDLRDSAGKTALDLAREKGGAKVAALLEQT